MIAEDPDPEELDAGLISAAQRVEHYEIAGVTDVSAPTQSSRRRSGTVDLEADPRRKKKKQTEADSVVRPHQRGGRGLPGVRPRQGGQQENGSEGQGGPSLILAESKIPKGEN